MSGEQVDLFFAIIAITSLAGSIGVVLLALASRLSSGTNDALIRARMAIGGSELFYTAGTAVGATLGSLYYSQIRGFEPCQLCWYQRIFMYPLAVLLVVALVKRDTVVRRYALPLALIGGGIAFYHNYVQIYPSLDAGGACGFGPNCSGKYINVFNNVSIPVMALAAFSTIAILLISLYLNERDTTALNNTTIKEREYDIT